MSKREDFWIEGDVVNQYNGKSSVVEIPEGITNVTIFWLINKERSIRKAVIPSSMTKIPDGMFQYCEKLREVILPETVEEIGAEAFKKCISLEKIHLPESLKKIGEDAFCNCTLLSKEVFQRAASTDGGEDFWDRIGMGGDINGCVVKDGILVKYCGSLTSVVISEGVRVIPKNMLPAVSDSWKLPKTLQRLEEQYSTNIEMNLPPKYLQTREKLPAKYTLELLEKRGAWHKKAKPEDYAGLYLFQTGKNLKELAAEELKKLEPETAWEAFTEVLESGATPAQILKAAEFAIQYHGNAPKDSMKKLYETAVKQKAGKAVKFLETFVGEGEDSAEDSAKKFAMNQVFQKYKATDKQISEVKLLNGKKAPAELVKQAIVPYLEQFAGLPSGISSYKTEYTKVHISSEADSAAEQLDRATLSDALEKIYNARLREDYKNIAPWLYPLARYGDEKRIAGLIADMNRWAKWDIGRATGRKRIIVARGALMLSDTREAIIKLDNEGLLDEYASIRNTSGEEIRDRKLSEFGLDERGKKTYCLGERIIELTLEPDMTVSLYDPSTGKTMKSVPKKGADPRLAAEAAEDFAALRKNIKRVVKARSNRLFASFLSGKTEPPEKWTSVYAKNPVFRQLAGLIVWNQGADTFVLSGDGPVDCQGEEYKLKEGVPIGVAHPMELDEGKKNGWKKYFTSHGLKQPFEQIWEPVIAPVEIGKDRYKDCKIPLYKFRGMEKHGIHFRYDYIDSFVKIDFEGCMVDYNVCGDLRHNLDLEAEVTINSFQFSEYTHQVNHIRFLLDQWVAVGKIKEDDASVSGLLENFTLAQIIEFIDLASELDCRNVLAVLMDYRNKKFADYDPMDAFTIDWEI